MPELPEVETVRRGLAPVMEGATLNQLELRRKDLRFPFPEAMAERLEGRKIASLGRRAKYLMMHFEGDVVLVCHLGMSGSYRVEDDALGTFHHERSKLAAHDHVHFHLSKKDGGKASVIYNDPRRFGFMFMGNTREVHEGKFLAGLGIEPTGNELSGAVIAKLMAGKATTLKAALLDQRLIAGLGNIYVCEALWRAGLSPKRKAGTLVKKDGKPTQKCVMLADHIRSVIDDAITAGGSSLKDHAQADGSLGYFQHSFAVYDQEGQPCRQDGCAGTVTRIIQSGRSTFFCPKCQR